MSSLIPLGIIALLVLLNGLFVAAEFGIVTAPRATIERRAAAGQRGATVVARILTDPQAQDRYIATAQLGVTFASLGLGMYGEHALAGWIEGAFDGWAGIPPWLAANTIASIVAVGLLTYVHIVLGEMVPKSLALHYGEDTALRVTPPMIFAGRVFFPLVVALNAAGVGVLRILGIDRSQGSQERYYSAEELEFVVEESLQGGMIHGGAGRVLRELFDLGGLTAEDVMVPRVQVDGVRLDASAEAIAAVLRETPHTRYPVYTDDLDDIIGVVHARDLAALVIEGASLRRSIVRIAPFVPSSTPLESVMRRMRDQRVQFAVVLDEHGGTAGCITPGDVSMELLGRVDESGTPSEMFEDATGRLRVAGTVRLDELGERLRRSITHDDIETVSGIVLALLERPPRLGDVVNYEGIVLQVTRLDGRGVAEALVVESPPEGADE
ncbi:MAG: HlyC/CorC family transporter [Chloroflexi bacterium]|nr:MAG: HlyC/CorC family transporter [Chloroflexota bacterium]